MKKYSIEWKMQQKNGWMQKHTDGMVYHHYIQYGCEYNKNTGFVTIKDAIIEKRA